MMELNKDVTMLQKLTQMLINGLAVIAGGITLMLMVLTALDVFLRFLINRPILGTFELTESMMCGIVFCAVAYNTAKGGDIKSDFVVKRFSQKTQAIIDIITSLLSLGLISLISWQSIVLAKNTWRAGEKTAT
jgi:TRAP-type C4-dicarboxylate transport system permease small subunit